MLVAILFFDFGIYTIRHIFVAVISKISGLLFTSKNNITDQSLSTLFLFSIANLGLTGVRY